MKVKKIYNVNHYSLLKVKNASQTTFAFSAVGLDPDMKPVVLTFICKLAVTDPRVRAVLCQHRGLELAR